jgi:hypothetical protein
MLHTCYVTTSAGMWNVVRVVSLDTSSCLNAGSLRSRGQDMGHAPAAPTDLQHGGNNK